MVFLASGACAQKVNNEQRMSSTYLPWCIQPDDGSIALGAFTTSKVTRVLFFVLLLF